MTDTVHLEPTDVKLFSDQQIRDLVEQGQSEIERRHLERLEKARGLIQKLLAEIRSALSDAGLSNDGHPIEEKKKGRPKKVNSHAAGTLLLAGISWAVVVQVLHLVWGT
jgi:hypothetical protein